jgi:hypothetical protein
MNLVEALKCDACGCECGQGKTARGEWRLGLGNERVGRSNFL